MVKTKSELKAIAQSYVNGLRARNINVDKIILFGSYGRGKPRKDSDIDLAFISKDFEKYNLFERQKILSECRKGFLPTDVIAYSPDMVEQKRNSSPLVRQILNEGITLYPF